MLPPRRTRTERPLDELYRHKNQIIDAARRARRGGESWAETFAWSRAELQAVGLSEADYADALTDLVYEIEDREIIAAFECDTREAGL